MKTTLRTLILFVSLAILMPTFTSCKSDDEPGKNDLIGSWVRGSGNIMTLTFYSDGSFLFEDDWTSLGHDVSRDSGTYSYNSNNSILVLNYTTFQDKPSTLNKTYIVLLVDDNALSLMNDYGDITTYSRR